MQLGIDRHDAIDRHAGVDGPEPERGPVAESEDGHLTRAGRTQLLDCVGDIEVHRPGVDRPLFPRIPGPTFAQAAHVQPKRSSTVPGVVGRPVDPDPARADIRRGAVVQHQQRPVRRAAGDLGLDGEQLGRPDPQQTVRQFDVAELLHRAGGQVGGPFELLGRAEITLADPGDDSIDDVGGDDRHLCADVDHLGRSGQALDVGDREAGGACWDGGARFDSRRIGGPLRRR